MSISKKDVSNLLNDFKLELISKCLDYNDDIYFDLELKSEKYFNDTFELHISSLENLLDKSIILTMERADVIINGYVNSWFKELNKFSDSFLTKSIGYFHMLFEKEMQYIFNYMFCQYFDEVIVKKLLNKFVEETMLNLNEYNDIYLEEYISHAQQLLFNKKDIINNVISKSLRRKNAEYKYEGNQFIEKIKSSELLYIDKYRELNKIAEKNGYVHTRTKGGHGIFVNNKTQKSIVIPQGRKIGRGLSIIIQKQILGDTKLIIQPKEKDTQQLEKNKKLTELKNRYDELKNRLHQAKDVNELIKVVDEQPDIFMSNDIAKDKTMELRESTMILELQQYLYGNKLSIAIEKAEEFLKKYPYSTKMSAMLGSIHELSGNEVKAMEYYKKHIDMDGEKYDVYTRVIEWLRDGGKEEEANLYIGIRQSRFANKINSKENIKKEICKGNFNNAIELIDRFEKEYISEISADDFLEIAKSFFENKNYKLARKYSNQSLAIYSQKEEAKQLNMVMDWMNV